MKIHASIPILLFLLCGKLCVARQAPIPLADLIEMGKWNISKVEKYVKGKGFPFEPRSQFPNDEFLTTSFYDTIVMSGDHTAPPGEEGEDSIKRSFVYCAKFSKFGSDEKSVFVRYYTSDYAEFESMKDYLQTRPEFLYDEHHGTWSDGQFEFRLEDARIKLNTMGRGGFIRRYMFRMKTPKRFIK